MSKILVLNEYETINKIKEGYSLARYGDGEFFNLLENPRGISKMQVFDEKLQKKLDIVFSSPLKRLLIGVPKMDSPKPWVVNFNKRFAKFIKNKDAYKESIFVSAFISRPALVNNNNQEYFDRVKSIWKKREVILINFNTNLLKHYMFEGCNIDAFIQISRRNCFDQYDYILNECKNYYGEKKIFLVSAGPVATALAYDLVLNKEQCIDIGQIAFEYSLFKNENNLQSWTSQNSYGRRKK